MEMSQPQENSHGWFHQHKWGIKSAIFFWDTPRGISLEYSSPETPPAERVDFQDWELFSLIGTEEAMNSIPSGNLT